MYASIEDAWSEPLLTASDRGFVLHPRYRPAFLNEQSADLRSGIDSYYEPRVQSEPPLIPLPPATQPYPHVSKPPKPLYRPARTFVEGFQSGGGGPGPASVSGGSMMPPLSARDDRILQELERLREELQWVRRERYELQRRMDWLCFLFFALALLCMSDLIRRWSKCRRT